jgi:hypothetical protein
MAVRPRAVVLLIVALCLAVAGWVAVRAGGSVTPDPEEPVVVGSTRVPATALEATAARSARRGGGSVPAARRAAADRAIERLWLSGEAAARGLSAEAELAALRGQVADALAGPGPLRDAAHLAATFDAFHARWRARTRCLPAYRDPYEDRCGDAAPAAAGTCHWMGEATLCSLGGHVRRRWLVVRAGGAPPTTRRFRSRAGAIALARAAYAAARATRARAAASAREAARLAEGARAQARSRARLRQERAARLRDPRLSERALVAARAACRDQVRASDPFMFGFGMQDVIGQAEGLVGTRAALMDRLAAAGDPIDRRKLQPLIAAVRDGSRELARIGSADATGDHAAVADRVARFDARTAPERAISRRLGLGECLVRPAAGR